MKPEMSVVCLTCQATLTLPLPDCYQTIDGEMIEATDSDEEVEMFRQVMESEPCPRCGGLMRLTLTKTGNWCEGCSEVLGDELQTTCSFCGNPVHVRCLLPHEASQACRP